VTAEKKTVRAVVDEADPGPRRRLAVEYCNICGKRLDNPAHARTDDPKYCVCREEPKR